MDRSPTGSGVTARVAVQFHKKQIQLGMYIECSCSSVCEGVEPAGLKLQGQLVSQSFTLLGQTRTFLNSKTNSQMTGKPLKVVPYGRYGDAVVMEVGGRGHYTGECLFWVEQGDELGEGFLVKWSAKFVQH